MKLYVVHPNTGQKIYLNISATTRHNLARQIGSYSFYANDIEYHINDVYAEIETNDTVAGAAVGGLVGTVAGPIGILVGGIVGGILGNTNDTSKMNAVRIFNTSQA